MASLEAGEEAPVDELSQARARIRELEQNLEVLDSQQQAALEQVIHSKREALERAKVKTVTDCIPEAQNERDRSLKRLWALRRRLGGWRGISWGAWKRRTRSSPRPTTI